MGPDSKWHHVPLYQGTIKAGGKHPTGMLSCSSLFFQVMPLIDTTSGFLFRWEFWETFSHSWWVNIWNGIFSLYIEISSSSYVFALWFVRCPSWLVSAQRICDNYYPTQLEKQVVHSYLVSLLRGLITFNIHTPDVILARWVFALTNVNMDPNVTSGYANRNV